jgi:hypothetical protein
MKKFIKRIIVIVLLLLPIMAIAHFIAFPQETRSILVSFGGFTKFRNIYFKMSNQNSSLDSILAKQHIATRNVSALWQNDTNLDYSIIYCNSEEEYNKYGQPGTPACTYRKLGAYVVLKEESIDTSIIAHEISHAIMYNNLGWYKTNYKIPTWFEEGLAMQVDEREKYAIGSLQTKINNGFVLPNVSTISKGAQFYAGDDEAITLHYVIAKYIIHEWLHTHSLSLFIKKMKGGDGFDVAYKESVKQ